MRGLIIGSLVALVIVCGAACAGAGRKPAPPGWNLDQPVLASYREGEVPFDGTLQVVAYNVERGFYREDVVRYLEQKRQRVPGTIVLLSECDRNHSRTGEVFVADAMARALRMDLAFVTEYIEYNDRTPEHQGDHGNAILSPFPLTEVTVIRHTDVYSWTNWGWIWGQPRFGERVTLAATVVLPGGKKLRVYSSHLESNGGTVGKWTQMAETVADADRFELPIVIGGDFNELPAGLMFKKLPEHGILNAFAGDSSPTGDCRPAGDRAKCALKIDWIVYRDLRPVESGVDYPLNSQGGVISDHAPVWAMFELN